jgi:hypothetical protein
MVGNESDQGGQSGRDENKRITAGIFTAGIFDEFPAPLEQDVAEPLQR